MSNLGAFAGNFLQAFTQTQQQYQQLQTQKKLIEATIKQKEAETEAFEVQTGGLQGIMEAMAGGLDQGIVQEPSTQAFEFGGFGPMAPTQQEIPGRKAPAPPMSFDEAILSPEGRGFAIQAGLSDEMLAAEERFAMNRLVRGIEETVAEGGDPREFVQNEGFADFVEVTGNMPRDTSLDDMAKLSTIQANASALRSRELADEAAALELRLAQEAAAQAAKGQQRGFEDLVTEIDKVIPRLMRLEGTFLRTGLPESGWRRFLATTGTALGVGNIMGVDQSLITDAELVNKELATVQRFLLDRAQDSLAETDSRLNFYLASQGGEDLSVGTNLVLLGDQLERTLRDADDLGLSIPERDTLRKLAQQIEEMYDPSFRGGDEAVDAGPPADRLGAVRSALDSMIGRTGEAASSLADQVGGFASSAADSAATEASELAAQVGGFASDTQQGLSGVADQVMPSLDSIRGYLNPEEFANVRSLVEEGSQESLARAREIVSAAEVFVRRIGEMTTEQLDRLDVSQMSDEAIEEARKRYERLTRNGE